MKEKRRKYSPTQKVSIVRELLEGGHSVSEISEKYRAHPTKLNCLKRQLFEGALDTFSRKPVRAEEKYEKNVEGLRLKVAHKNGLIAELLGENMKLIVLEIIAATYTSGLAV